MSNRPGSDPRSWFGPKRIGWGYRPQTWQGWSIVLTFCAIMIVIASLV